MKARCVLLVALGAVVTVTSVAAAAPETVKQRVAVDTKILPEGRFALSPLQSGTLKRDSGTVSGNWQSLVGRHVMRNGQAITIYNARWTFTGKRGTLTIRERSEWVDIAGDANDDGAPDGVAFGTWKVVRGTGQYVKLAGGGRSAHEGLGLTWYARYDGFLTSK